MVVAKVIENTDTATLDGFVRQTVSENVSLIATDEHSGYRLLKPSGLPHEVVSHGQDEYVRGEVHTNNIESFWSLFKRGIMGQFHHVKKDYLPLYLNEFSYRHNNRKHVNLTKPISDKQRAKDEKLREELRHFDIKKFDKMIEKTFQPPSKLKRG
jgi:ISXO2-like transposase domain